MKAFRALRSASSALRMGAVAARAAAQPARVLPTSFVAARMMARKADTTSELVAVLEDEIKYETDDYEQMPEISEYLQNSPFKVVESENSTLVRLVRTYNKEEIEVSFDHYVAREYVSDEAEEEQDTKTFKVIISKKTDGADKGALIFECASSGGALVIENVLYHPDSSLAKAETLEAEMDFNFRFSGIFSEFDEKVQDLLTDYLYERKVDDALAEFVLNYAADKDAREYKNLLINMKKHLSA
eukprot:Colp12_sorted_trinity150504_noHs@6509